MAGAGSLAQLESTGIGGWGWGSWWVDELQNKAIAQQIGCSWQLGLAKFVNFYRFIQFRYCALKLALQTRSYWVTQNKVNHLLAILHLIFEVNITQVSYVIHCIIANEVQSNKVQF